MKLIIFVILGVALGPAVVFGIDNFVQEINFEPKKPEPPKKAFQTVPLKDQVVIPVIENEKITSLVIMTISFSISNSDTKKYYDVELNVRDALINTLFEFAYDGGFTSRFGHPDNFLDLKSRLLAAGKTILGDDLEEVLIGNLTRQDIG